MHVPDGLAWELVVIDNGSSDNTSDVALSFSDRIPVRVVREDVPGLSNARNRGVAEARGEYICWTDDDVVIDPDWLCAYTEAFRKHPEAAIFGGRVNPFLEGGCAPDWFESRREQPPISSLLAYRDFGNAELMLSFLGDRTPYGANFAVRAIDQRKALFDPDLGVSPTHKRLGEETEVFFRLFKTGACGWWVPGAMVTHIIPPARQTKSYVYEYYYLVGSTMAFVRSRNPVDNHLIIDGYKPVGYELSAWRCFRRGINRLIRYKFTSCNRSEQWLHLLADAGYFMGAASFGSRYAKQLLDIKSWV